MGALKSAVRAFCIAPKQELTLFAGQLSCLSAGMSNDMLLLAQQDIHGLGHIGRAQLGKQLLLICGLPSALGRRGDRLAREFFNLAFGLLILGPGRR